MKLDIMESMSLCVTRYSYTVSSGTLNSTIPYHTHYYAPLPRRGD